MAADEIVLFPQTEHVLFLGSWFPRRPITGESVLYWFPGLGPRRATKRFHQGGWHLHARPYDMEMATVAITDPKGRTVAFVHDRSPARQGGWKRLLSQMPVAGLADDLHSDDLAETDRAWATVQRLHEIGRRLSPQKVADAPQKACAALAWAPLPAAAAAGWRGARVEPRDALVYHRAGMSPDDFPAWALSNPHERRWPRHVADLYTTGITAAEAHEWLWKAGCWPEEYVGLIRAGYAPAQARALFDAVYDMDDWPGTDEAALRLRQDWATSGLPPNLTPLAVQAGLNPKRASREYRTGTLTEEGLRVLVALRAA